MLGVPRFEVESRVAFRPLSRDSVCALPDLTAILRLLQVSREVWSARRGTRRHIRFVERVRPWSSSLPLL
jgi:hypothetical protein